MRWEDERYVKLYTRDSADWLALSFEAQALFVLLLRKCDGAGLLELGKQGKRGIAAVVGHTGRWDTIAPALEELLADGCLQMVDVTPGHTASRAVLPNFIAAQEARASDKSRKRGQRERDRDQAMESGFKKSGQTQVRENTGCDGHAESQPVTRGHAESHAVTTSPAQPSPSQEKPAGGSAAPPPARPASAPADSRHARAVAAFKARFEATHPGTPWRYTPADGPALKRLLAFPEATDAELDRRMCFAFQDEWFRQHGTLAVFCSKWATWTPAKPVRAAYEGIPSFDTPPAPKPLNRGTCAEAGCKGLVFVDAIKGPSKWCTAHHLEHAA